MAPNGLPLAPTIGTPTMGTPTVGIVPGTAIGDVMGVAGARRVFVDRTWATAVPQPNKTKTNIVRSERRIKTSWQANRPIEPTVRSLPISD
jgi:hypothetical protein